TSERRTALAMKPLTLLLRRIAHAGWQTAQQVRWKRAPAWNDRWGADRRLAGDADHGRLPRHDRRLIRLCRRLGDRGRYGRGGRRRNHAGQRGRHARLRRRVHGGLGGSVTAADPAVAARRPPTGNGIGAMNWRAMYTISSVATAASARFRATNVLRITLSPCRAEE